MRAESVTASTASYRLPTPRRASPELTRYRLASKVVNGQPLGGTDDEWVVIELVYRAAELAEDLHDDRQEGALLFGRFAFSVRYKWFRNWVNSPAGRRLGLAPSPMDRSI
ncbi:hypothetical protein [Streptomyces sp. GESEQ-35]|uniref:hypothetical protein n=1 Tax=Streptomyces sp. GESEQ-35 TaxID=2812657 RepID=UPI001B3446DA|nr:hypothetical protein [Streptomyces sp. GESEQ-35]